MFNIPSFFGFRAGGESLLPFEFTVNTAIAGTSGIGNFQLPLVNSLTLDAVVDWGDDSSDTITTFNQAETLHTYSSADTYTIKITGDLSGWRFANGGDRLKMLNVVTWGALNISVDQGFHGCTNLTCSATDAPIITSTSLLNYFQNCTNFNGAIGNWNVSNVTIMTGMFFGATAFNQDIGAWNVSNVTIMNAMFFGATNFNPNIGSWNVSNVTNMNVMFRNATAFDQDIGAWNVSNVTNMGSMFQFAAAFNQDIGLWDVSNVTNFNSFMLGKTNLNYSAANLSSIYDQWSLLPVQPNLSINFGTIDYFVASEPNKLILTNAPNFWTIIDGDPI